MLLFYLLQEVFISLPLIKVPISTSARDVCARYHYADTILVMKDGQIIEQGTHQELLSQDSVYKGMWEKQSISLG